MNEQKDTKLYKNLGHKMILWFKKDPNHFWLKEFFIENNLLVEEIEAYAKEDIDFSRALKIAHMYQEMRLVNKGLEKSRHAKSASSMAKFILQNEEGWTDKKELNIAGDFGSGSIRDEINKIENHNNRDIMLKAC